MYLIPLVLVLVSGQSSTDNELTQCITFTSNNALCVDDNTDFVPTEGWQCYDTDTDDLPERCIYDIEDESQLLVEQDEQCGRVIYQMSEEDLDDDNTEIRHTVYGHGDGDRYSIKFNRTM